MKIVKVEAVALEATFARSFGGIDKVPPQLLRPAAHFQKIVRAGQYTTLVFITADSGETGVGEAFGLPDPVATASLVRRVIAPGLIGGRVTAPEDMLKEYFTYFGAMGHTRGPALEALSGVDTALWDLKAKAARLPLCALLGRSQGPVPLYASPVPFLPTTAGSQTAAKAYVAEGYKAIKLKIGRGVATDLDHIAAVRDAIGPSIGLMLDANCAYDETTAIELGRQLHTHRVAWYEEPIPPGDPAAMARVRARSSVPIATGENEFSRADFVALIKAGAADYLMPNIARAGGISGLLAIGQLCAEGGVKLSPHGVGSCVALAAALHVCRAALGFAFYEANRLLNPLRDDMAAEQPRLIDGALLTPGTLGHGGDPDLARMTTYLVRPEFG